MYPLSGTWLGLYDVVAVFVVVVVVVLVVVVFEFGSADDSL